MIGAVAKLVGGTIDGERQLAALDEAISTVEQACDRPLLEGLAGAERYRSAAALLDATLLARMKEAATADKRAQLVERYLVHLHEEFTMAKADLKTATASRAEVVALGLALREVALALDTELAAFRGSTAQTERELRDAAEKTRGETLRHVEHAAAELDRRVDQNAARLNAHVQDEIASAAATLASTTDAGVHEAREALSAETERRVADTHVRLTAQLDGQAREIRAGLQQHAERTHAQLATRLDAQVQEVRQELDGRAQAADAAHRREIGRLNEENRAALQADVARVATEHARRMDGLQEALEAGSRAHQQALRTVADDLRGTIHGVSHQLQETIATQHAQHLQAVDEIRNAQVELRNGMAEMEQRLRMWIYAVLALALVAFLVAL